MDSNRPANLPLGSRIRSAIRVLLGRELTPVPIGSPHDGLTPLYASGSEIDRNYSDLYKDMNDALEVWRFHPLARRIVGLITAYVIGDGIELASKYPPLQRFTVDFWNHDRNRLLLRQAEWCDELTRSGELFLVLFTNPVDGMSHIRAVPARCIDGIRWKEHDYEVELAYHEKSSSPLDTEGTWWYSFDHPKAQDPGTPIMLHFAVNRPVGALRGEGDLTPILPWLKRYSRWLEDRIRLNAGMRSFLWIVYASRSALERLRAQYKKEPDPGSIIIAEDGAERWEAVNPNLHAADAEKDGRAIRWMIASGGPGTGLTDFGEAEDANLATATVMVDIRRRFLRRRQSYFVWMLTELTLRAYTRSRGIRNANRREISHADFIVNAPDISSEDNNNLATAVKSLTDALLQLQGLMGDSTELRELALRLFAKFAEESIPDPIADAIITKGEKERARRQKLEEEVMRHKVQPARQPASRPPQEAQQGRNGTEVLSWQNNVEAP